MTTPLSDALLGLGGGSGGSRASGRGSDPASTSRFTARDAFASRDRSGTGTGPSRSSDPPGSDGGARERGDPGRGAERMERRDGSRAGGSPSEAPPPARPASSGARGGGSTAAAAAAASARPVSTPAESAGPITVVGTVRGLGARTATLPEPASPPAGEATAARAQKLAEQAGRGSGFVLVPFQDEAGAEGRVRLSVRGSALNATILSSDREAVEQLGRRLGELHRALAARGFAEAQLSVREHRAAPSNPGRQAPQEHPGHPGHDHPERDSRKGTGDRSRPGARFTFDTRQVNHD
jgi:hypothetical protein